MVRREPLLAFGHDPMHQAAVEVGWTVVGTGAGLAEVVLVGEGLLNTFPPQELI